MEEQRRQKSTNPFDSSDEESLSEDVFHECRYQSNNVVKRPKRTAQLDFNFDAVETSEEPALRFDSNVGSRQRAEFVSPLESALIDFSAEHDTDISVTLEGEGSDDDEHDDDEDIPTKSESQWLSLIRKASGSLVSGSPFQRSDSGVTPPRGESNGLSSRRSSFGSYKSARSMESDMDNSITSLGEDNARTPPQSRRGSRQDDPPSRKNSLKRGLSSRRKLFSSAKKERPSPVLEKLASYDKDFDFDSSSSPWSKMILLEELGTASSWTILLLPYIAFFIAILLDTHSALLVKRVGPFNASKSCMNIAGSVDVPVIPAPSKSCAYRFALQTGQGILANGKNSYVLRTFHYKSLMRNGTAFSSGPIDKVSPMSTFLNGDVTFYDLPTDVVSLVARGRVTVSAIVVQRATPENWVPVFVAKPGPLSMVCTPNTERNERPSSLSLWNCSSPRIVDAFFPLPGTGLLSGSELRVNVLYSPFLPVPVYPSDDTDDDSLTAALDSGDKKGTTPFVFSNTAGSETILSEADVSHPNKLIARLVKSSSYVFEHESQSYAKVKVAVRLSTLIVSFLFTVFWCWSLGGKGFFTGWNCCCSGMMGCFRRHNEEETTPLTGSQKEISMWWESPWIVFPERRYLLVLLLCLMMIQSPLLVYAYFDRELYALAKVHTIADIMIGIGVHGYLMMWLCLVQGVRYHTASFARRRAKHQRQLLELRRTAKYMAKNEDNGTDDYVGRYMTDHYDQYGDVEGIRSAGSLAIRLKNDPCGDSWADFLLPKLFLFVIGATAVILTASCRFPNEAAAALTPTRLHRLNALYVTGSFIQMFVLLFWLFLILRNAVLTGAKLRKEPFLNTRPAQLAYRVLLGMLFLGVGAVAVPLLIDLYKVFRKWKSGQKTQDNDYVPQAVDQSPIIDILLETIWHASERFPYSGSAASFGPGKILFATTIALVSAFIFLPSRPYYEAEYDATKKDGDRNVVGDEGGFPLVLVEKVKQRRDKRLVVSLARHTHSWRTFPLPIKKVKVGSKILSETSFQLNQSDRSVVYFGKYTPVFCLEIACWLLEASWQAYYSPKDFSLDDWAPGRMSLESIGLRLEKSVIDESTHIQAYIASNVASQVDGEEDTIIVVAFRGTASTRNMQTDLNFKQVPLVEQIIGTDEHTTFHVRADGIDAYDTERNFWNIPAKASTHVTSVSPSKGQDDQDSAPDIIWHDDKQSTLAAVSSGAKNVIKATPMARQALPCVHEGFLAAYLIVRRQVIEGVLEVLQRQFSSAINRAKLNADESLDEDEKLVLPKIYVTGHSLGGSLAQLLALDIASNCELVLEVPDPDHNDVDVAEDFFLLPTPPENTSETRTRGRLRFFSFDETLNSDDAPTPKPRSMCLQPPIAVYTYGQPRVGNHAFARLYKQRVPHTFRVACEGDAFTTMPPTLLCGWRGVYKHAGLEVMLDEGCTGNILVGPTVVETLFRFTKVRTSVAAHSMERYRDGLESALGQDELEEYYRGHGSLKEARDPYASTSTEVPEWLTRIKRSSSQEP